MSERWKPEHGKIYCFVNCSGHVGSYIWEDDSTDCACYESGNCFRTEEEAEAAAEKVKELLLKLHDNGTSTANSKTLKGTFIEYLKKCAEIQADIILQKAKEYKSSEQCSNAPEETTLPKLTAEVFDRPDCPEWAQYAVVDVQGLAYWYQYPPLTDKRIGVWKTWGNKRQLIDGFFDRSDWQNSLIERPAKLPDWCKPGEWVYADGKDGYGKVYEIKDYIRVKMENGRSVNQISEYKINELSRARLRPYNADEMRELVGKIIESKDYTYFINAYDKGLQEVVSGGDGYTAKALLEFGYTIDGKPCGVLEHRENGEWVE